jgi:hypothetical protein
MKRAVVYAYYPKDSNYIENFEYFVKHGISPHVMNKMVDFYIIVNGPADIGCLEKYNSSGNLKILHRPNKNFDFGAYADLFAHVGGIQSWKYNVTYFINSSVRGPVLPPYYHSPFWVPFEDLLLGDVHMVGTTINACNSKSDSKNWRPMIPANILPVLGAPLTR